MPVRQRVQSPAISRACRRQPISGSINIRRSCCAERDQLNTFAISQRRSASCPNSIRSRTLQSRSLVERRRLRLRRRIGSELKLLSKQRSMISLYRATVPSDSSSSRAFPFGPRMIGVVSIAACFGLPVSLARGQPDGYSRVSIQQEAESAGWRSQEKIGLAPRPLDSDAQYTCTISGSGKIAHCYAR